MLSDSLGSHLSDEGGTGFGAGKDEWEQGEERRRVGLLARVASFSVLPSLEFEQNLPSARTQPGVMGRQGGAEGRKHREESVSHPALEAGC